MADIDIFSIEPTQLCKDLRGRFIMLYGQAKSGKTSMSVMWPKPLLCAFERGYNALVGVKPVDINSWADFKKVCRQLKQAKKSDDPKIRDMYETVVIDTVAIAYAYCEKFVLAREGVSAIGDIAYGKGWGMLKSEFEDTFRELTQLGYAIVFIAHSKTKQTEYTDENGDAIEALAPDLPNAPYQIVNRMVDVIGYIGVEYDVKSGEASRYLYTRGTPRIFAGSRYKYLEPKIELSYKNLVDAIASAMEKEANLTGTEVVNGTGTLQNTYSRPFADTMTEARELWTKIIEKHGDNGKESMKAAIHSIFNRDIQLSKATEDQQDLVELVIEEFKRIM